MSGFRDVRSVREKVAKMFFRNALGGAGIFLPVFLAVVPLEGLVRGADLAGEFNAHFGYALYLYVAFVIPVVLGSLVNSVTLLLIPDRWSKSRQRVAAISLSPIVPATVLAIGGLGGSALLLERIVATVVATLSYGAFCGSSLDVGH